MRIAPSIAVLSLAAVAAAPTTAREVSYESIVCSHARHMLLEAGPDMVAFGVEQWGVVARTNVPEFENGTTHCVGYLRIVAGKPIGKGMCKWIAASGDTAVGEWEHPESGDNRWTWLSGTGAFKGISGANGSFKALGPTKPAAPGTSQNCRRDWGSFTLP